MAKRMINVTMTNTRSTQPTSIDPMKGNHAVKQFLIDAGFKYAGSCNCGGMFTNKFQIQTPKGLMEIRARAGNYLVRTAGSPYLKHPMSDLKQLVEDVKKNIAEADSSAEA